MAAEASYCAGEQGKYWEYHDLLFANQEKQGREDLVALARGLQLNDKVFDACLDSPAAEAQVEQDLKLGNGIGVVTSPTFL